MSVHGQGNHRGTTVETEKNPVTVELTAEMEGDRQETSKTDNFRSQKCRDIKTEWWDRQWLGERDHAKLKRKTKAPTKQDSASLWRFVQILKKMYTFWRCAVCGDKVGPGRKTSSCKMKQQLSSGDWCSSKLTSSPVVCCLGEGNRGGSLCVSPQTAWQL